MDYLLKKDISSVYKVETIKKILQRSDKARVFNSMLNLHSFEFYLIA